MLQHGCLFTSRVIPEVPVPCLEGLSKLLLEGVPLVLAAGATGVQENRFGPLAELLLTPLPTRLQAGIGVMLDVHVTHRQPDPPFAGRSKG